MARRTVYVGGNLVCEGLKRENELSTGMSKEKD